MRADMQDPWESRWQLEEDVRALARVREIERDAVRMADARAKANEEINEKVADLANLANIAGMQVTLNNSVGYKYNNPAKIRNL